MIACSCFLHVGLQHAAQAADDVADNALKVKIAIHASFAANCILAILQLYGAASSASVRRYTLLDPSTVLCMTSVESKENSQNE